MNILIAGDSFSSASLSGTQGWPYLLTQKHQVTNISVPGTGEYKILKSLEQQHLDQYDAIIISHTSPNRVHCEQNPLYPVGHLYRSSDVIFADCESKAIDNNIARHVMTYFTDMFDLEYYKFVHSCCCQKIDRLTESHPVIHMTNFDWSDLYAFPDLENFYDLWLQNRGDCAHYTPEANQIILNRLEIRLDFFA